MFLLLSTLFMFMIMIIFISGPGPGLYGLPAAETQIAVQAV
jgi:hypothetical protein